MTKNDIIRMVQEAGFYTMQGSKGELYALSYQHMEKFANLVAAAEREACAALCDTEANREELDGDTMLGARYGAYCCAQAIRERGAP